MTEGAHARGEVDVRSWIVALRAGHRDRTAGRESCLHGAYPALGIGDSLLEIGYSIPLKSVFGRTQLDRGLRRCGRGRGGLGGGPLQPTERDLRELDPARVHLFRQLRLIP